MSPSDPQRRDDTFAQLLTALEVPLARTLSRFRIPAQDAEDLLQETLLLYVTKQAGVRDPSAWISTTLRNRCVIYWRRRRASLVETFDDVLLESLGAREDAHPARCQLTRDLSQAIARLPERCRHVLRLRYALDCDGPEIAQRLGYQDSSIRQVTHRCLSALSVQMVSGGYRAEVTA